MKLEHKINLLKSLFKKGYGANEDTFVDVITEFMEDPAAFLRYYRHLYEKYVENDSLLELLEAIGVLEDLLPVARAYGTEPEARKALDMMIEELAKVFRESNLEPLPKDDVLIPLIRAAQANEVISVVEQLKVADREVINPVKLAGTSLFLDNETLIREFLATIVDRPIPMLNTGVMLGELYLKTHPFLIFLYEQGVLDQVNKELLRGRNIDSLLREEIDRHFSENGTLLDLEEARKECDQFCTSLKIQTLLDEYEAGRLDMEGVLTIAERIL